MSRKLPEARLPPERRCPATCKIDRQGRGGGQCRRSAGAGTPHLGFGLCFNHGGLSPGGIRQGERLKAQAAAQSFGLPIETTPEEALTQELWRTAGIVAWLGGHVQTVEPSRRLTGEMAEYARLYSEERTRLLAVARAAIDTGLDERRVSAIERAADAFGTALRAILDELGVLHDPRAPAIVERHLRALGPGGDDAP